MGLYRTIFFVAVVPVLVLGLPKEIPRSRRASGPVCYSCLGTSDPSSCQRTTACEEDEVCYVEKIDIGGGVQKFNLGCTRQFACNLFHGTGVFGRRNVRSTVLSKDKRVTPLCNECCVGDNCNTNQCGTGSPTATAPVPTVPSQVGTYVRLTGGSNPYEGRVEVYHNGRWGTICDDNWGGVEAAVICGMLGYSREGSGGLHLSAFGSAPFFAPILLDDVNCTGTESNIGDCQHNAWGNNDCSHLEDASVECSSVGRQDNLIYLLDTKLQKIVKMDIDTQSFGEIPLNPLYSPIALDYDPTEERLYFVDSHLKQIVSAHFSGADIRLLKQLDQNADLEKIDVDPINKKLFYADAGNDFIASINLDGSGFKIVANGSIDKPRDVVSDPTNRIVYWTDWGNNSKIEMANYDGSGRQVIASGNMKWPNGLALDYSENKLYFCDAGTDRIEVMSTDGSNRKTIYTASNSSSHMFALSLFKQYIYFTDWDSPNVMRINKDGTGLTPVGPPSFRELADILVHKDGYGLAGLLSSSPEILDESHTFVRLMGNGTHNEGLVEVYANGIWGTICDDLWDNNDAAVICDMMGFGKTNAQAVPEAGFGSNSDILIFLDDVNCTGNEAHIDECTKPTDWGVHNCGHNEDAGVICQLDPNTIKSFILAADYDIGVVYRMDMETGSYSEIPNQNVSLPVGIDYDTTGHLVYYTDDRLGAIMSTKLDGTGEKPVKVLNRYALPEGVAVDSTNRLIFYTDNGNNVIGKMGMDGSNSANIVSANLDKPRAITVDSANQKVYWTDWGSSPKIECSNYDGTGRTTVLSAGLQQPNGLTYDAGDNKLYFCDAVTHLIESVDTDGSNRKTIFEDDGAKFFGLDTDSTHIYFSDWNKDGVLRIKKDGTGETPVGPPSFGRLNGIALYKAQN